MIRESSFKNISLIFWTSFLCTQKKEIIKTSSTSIVATKLLICERIVSPSFHWFKIFTPLGLSWYQFKIWRAIFTQRWYPELCTWKWGISEFNAHCHYLPTIIGDMRSTWCAIFSKELKIQEVISSFLICCNFCRHLGRYNEDVLGLRWTRCLHSTNWSDSL